MSIVAIKSADNWPILSRLNTLRTISKWYNLASCIILISNNLALL